MTTSTGPVHVAAIVPQCRELYRKSAAALDAHFAEHAYLIEDQFTVADIIVAVDEPIDATGCGGKTDCMGEDSGKCMTHDLWASLNSKMIEFLDSVSLKKLVDEQIAKGVSIEEHPVKRAISSQPVVKPIKVTAPNSVFALGNAFNK